MGKEERERGEERYTFIYREARVREGRREREIYIYIKGR